MASLIEIMIRSAARAIGRRAVDEAADRIEDALTGERRTVRGQSRDLTVADENHAVTVDKEHKGYSVKCTCGWTEQADTYGLASAVTEDHVNV